MARIVSTITELAGGFSYGRIVFTRKPTMAFENTITERDLDANATSFVQGLRAENDDFEPDLAVDGLSDSVLSRLLGLFQFGKSKR